MRDIARRRVLVVAVSVTAILLQSFSFVGVVQARPAKSNASTSTGAPESVTNTTPVQDSTRQDVSPPIAPTQLLQTQTDYPELGGTADYSDIPIAQPAELPLADAIITIPASDARENAALTKQTTTIASRSANTFNGRITYLKTAPLSEDGTDAGASVSPVGVAFTLDVDAATRAAVASSSTREVKLGVDYSAIDMPFGGDFVERLALYEGHDCTVADDGTVTNCNRVLPLHGIHDYSRRQLVITLDSDTLARWAQTAPRGTSASPASASDTSTQFPSLPSRAYIPMLQGGIAKNADPTPIAPPEETDKPVGRPIIILASGSDGPTGDYGATPVGDVLDFQVGLFTGAGQVNYPIPVPPPAAGTAPDVSLNYDSGQIDGTGIARSAQPGAVGIGWTQKAARLCAC